MDPARSTSRRNDFRTVAHAAAMSRVDRRASPHGRSIESRAADIASRLRGVCRHLGDDELNALAADMASMQGRFAEIEAKHARHDPVDRSCEERLNGEPPITA